jgi:hypothetical protein
VFPGRSAFRVVSKPAYESLYSIFLAIVCFRCHQSILKVKMNCGKTLLCQLVAVVLQIFLLETVKAVKNKQTVDIF